MAMGQSQKTHQVTAARLPLGGEWFVSDYLAGAVRSFREAMVKDRRPFAFLGWRFRTNVSNMCGHASFGVLALAYLETDVLALRGYAASGIGLSILFQFYRAQPLWIPIGWNGIFLLINATMIGLLLKERNDADKLEEDPEQAGTFREVFQPVELTPVDFVRLLDLADRRFVPEGEHLSEAGRVQDEVFLIVEGTAEVESEGVAVCHLEPKQFVGSMAFNRFIQSPAPAHPRNDSTSTGTGGLRATSPSKGSSTSGTTAYRNRDEGELEYIDDSYIEDNYVPGGGGVFEEAKEVALDLLRRESIVGEVAKSFVVEPEAGRDREPGAGMERSATTVTTTSDVIVYAWDMHLLRAFIKRRPLAGASLQKAISADLTRKVDQSRGHDERYRLLLAEALDGGVVTPIEKKKLHRYRDVHHIASAEHEEILRQHHWSEEDFEAGFQEGVVPRDGSKDFLKYEALVQRELAKGQVEDKGRQQLRRFRAQAGIDAQEHLLALKKQGWTADDYEVGGKGKAADFDRSSTSSTDSTAGFPKPAQKTGKGKAPSPTCNSTVNGTVLSSSSSSPAAASSRSPSAQEKDSGKGTGGNVGVPTTSASASDDAVVAPSKADSAGKGARTQEQQQQQQQHLRFQSRV